MCVRFVLFENLMVACLAWRGLAWPGFLVSK